MNIVLGLLGFTGAMFASLYVYMKWVDLNIRVRLDPITIQRPARSE